MAADTKVALGSTNHVLRSCSICLEDDMGDEVATLLPCNHSFCRGCIRQWLQAAPGCPQCREENIEAFFYQNEVHPLVDMLPEILCQACSTPGDLIVCDDCNLLWVFAFCCFATCVTSVLSSWHLHCLSPPLQTLPQGSWFCPKCAPSHRQLKPSSTTRPQRPQRRRRCLPQLDDDTDGSDDAIAPPPMTVVGYDDNADNSDMADEDDRRELLAMLDRDQGSRLRFDTRLRNPTSASDQTLRNVVARRRRHRRKRAQGWNRAVRFRAGASSMYASPSAYDGGVPRAVLEREARQKVSALTSSLHACMMLHAYRLTPVAAHVVVSCKWKRTAGPVNGKRLLNE
eukprot:m.133493 g.133493  ORF g.133493 m.133493 type:complete len:342 (+) comp15951_c0_seq26:324-1349(+)